MVSIAWSEDLRIGIDMLDEQHHMLVRQMVALEAALQSNLEAHDIHGYLVDMFEYARVHFAAEETLMFPYAGRMLSYEEHLQQHAGFMEQTLDFIERFKAQERDRGLGREIYVFLATWLINHIKVVDKAMLQELRELGALND